eukprot:CAMPEP_0173129592 /NCGR_PEP_ID=MMETSP1102-20130122/59348_1 /TAXON_ID=49646 /ORGANISM="Geminigera sp., Strain Caron Lab Isolate" /LENGTH=37 /DNA_ID= /DNA_START= /DNA_END= /DNA_ORIENTATION=
MCVILRLHSNCSPRTLRPLRLGGERMDAAGDVQKRQG